MTSLSSSNRGMWIFWTSFGLFLTATHAVKCPQMCDCRYPSYQQLKVDCRRRKVNESTLAQELDQQLSDEELREGLTSLEISSTPLSQVPISVCQLRNMTTLKLDYNRLTRLPDNCFTSMQALQRLSARNNIITQLQDGLFDGLNSLTELNFEENQITSIGLRVFSNESDLVRLKQIYLKYNSLQSLDPWPIIRGFHGSKDSKVIINADDNPISNFTNNIHWQFNRSMHSYAILHLWDNNIRYFTDMKVGWNLTYASGLFSFIERHPLFEPDIQYSESYTCDCKDFFLQTFQRYFVNYDFLSRLVCSAPLRLRGTLVRQVPLKEFECEVSDRCPSSCQCVYRPANATLHVYCSASNLSSLPFDLPPLPKSYVRYKLDFSNNKFLRRLEGRTYLVNTSILDVSNCAIRVVHINAWRKIAEMQSPFVTPHVYLEHNEIKSLPFAVSDINFTSVHFTLNHNPWECSCENRWMIDWFKSLSVTSSNVGDAMCASPSRLKGRSIAQSTKYDFCVDPSTKMLKISLLSTLIPVVVLLTSGFAVYHLRVRLFRRWKFHPFDRDECVGEDMDYDVFLCCSSEDDNPHGLSILREIESRGYRVCHHERDFLPGQLITDNMAHGTERSRRTVCLISKNFLERYRLI